MAVLEIPVAAELLFFTQRTVLDGVPYTITVRFNTRMDRWLLDVLDEDGADLLLGLPLVADWILTANFKGRVPGLFKGDLYVLDTTGQGRVADRDNFGKDVKLFYQEAAQ